MTSSHGHQDKLSLLKISRQSRPFIDKDLQIQLPEIEEGIPALYSSIHSSPIYTYYAKSQVSHFSLPSFINEKEINQSMTEAEKSYQAWQRFKNQLLKTSKKFLSKS